MLHYKINPTYILGNQIQNRIQTKLDMVKIQNHLIYKRTKLYKSEHYINIVNQLMVNKICILTLCLQFTTTYLYPYLVLNERCTTHDIHYLCILQKQYVFGIKTTSLVY